MFNEKFKRKYALSDAGVANIKKGMYWTIIVNLLVMSGAGILYKLMATFMNTLIYGEPLGNLGIYLAAAVVFLLLSYITHLQQYHATYGLVYREVKNMRIGLAEQLRKLPLSYFEKRDLADLTETIMGDVNRMEHVWSHVLGYLNGAYVSTAIIAIGLFVVNYKMAIACLWSVVAAFILLFGSRKLSEKNSTTTKKYALRVADGMQEVIENIREIHSVSKEEDYLKDISKRVDEHEKKTIYGEFITGLFVNGSCVIMRLGVATTILMGTKLILGGEIDFMTLFMFLLVITRIYAPFDQSLMLIAEAFLSEVSAKRLMEIYESETAGGSNEFHPANHDITFKNVSFAYDDELILDDVSFVAKEGEVTALVGPSGSGKSTCARLATRLWDVNQGGIYVGDTNIKDIDPETLLTDYSMVFQNVILFDDTVMENIRLGKHGASDEEVYEAAKLANCDEFVSKMREGYQSNIGENGIKLSGGERKRISIARAILKKAPIVVLDEATASLDVENETQVQEALSHLLKGKTVLVIAHRMRTVEASDQIVVLKEGKVVEEGSPKELVKKNDSIFKHMLELQKESSAWSI